METIRSVLVAIEEVKNFFQKELALALNLDKTVAPLFVEQSSGLNDNLNGVERPVTFKPAYAPDQELEIVQSLAKWKRLALAKYDYNPGEGIYTEMNAIRKDEQLSNLHSIYVDQWDWEKVINASDRNLSYLKQTASQIYDVIKKTDKYITTKYPTLMKITLPDQITFITSQNLEDEYPNLSPKEREHEAAKKYRAIFLMQIGDNLNSGQKHDGRAPDYDDWSLNGDIILWYPVLECPIEISSMGIRVDRHALISQSEKSSTVTRLSCNFHKSVLDNVLPLTIGGGIGRSRVSMYFLRKKHIGQVQVSTWDSATIKQNREKGVILL